MVVNVSCFPGNRAFSLTQKTLGVLRKQMPLVKQDVLCDKRLQEGRNILTSGGFFFVCVITSKILIDIC